MVKLVEIKISVSEKMDQLIQEISDELGVKKTEFVKNIVINELIKRGDSKNGG